MVSSGVWSLSARRAWIEINYIKSRIYDRRVALRKESVDRNPLANRRPFPAGVALRKESVDRNCMEIAYTAGYSTVALRKESVDRNFGGASRC